MKVCLQFLGQTNLMLQQDDTMYGRSYTKSKNSLENKTSYVKDSTSSHAHRRSPKLTQTRKG